MSKGFVTVTYSDKSVIELDENYLKIIVATEEDVRFSKVTDMFYEIDFEENTELIRSEITNKKFDNYEIFEIVFKAIVACDVILEEDEVEPSTYQIKNVIERIREEFPIGQKDRFVPTLFKNVVFYAEKLNHKYH